MKVSCFSACTVRSHPCLYSNNWIGLAHDDSDGYGEANYNHHKGSISNNVTI